MYYEVLEAGLEYKPTSFISRVKNIIEILEARAYNQGNTVCIFLLPKKLLIIQFLMFMLTFFHK